MSLALRYRLIDVARGTRAITLLNKLRRQQYALAAELAGAQQRRLQTYFDALRAAVPQYAQYTDFAQLPVIDKRYINRHRESLMNPRYRGKLVRKKTGGSTGEPLVYFTGTEAQSYLWAGLFLSWEAAGYQLGDKVAFLAGSSLFASGYKQSIYYRLLKVTILSAFDLSPARMDEYGATLDRGRHRLLYGYASAIHRMARHFLDTGHRPRTALRAIVCTAETLTAAMRADIEAAFGVPCYSQYGCNDAGVSAFECEQRNGFHLLSPRCYTEVLDDGRLIATDLSNDAMFMPRYDTGDLVRMSGRQCPCGRGLPLIDEVVGRSNDVVVDPAGAAVHSEFFTHLFREDRRIHSFQVVFDQQLLQINLHGAELDGPQQQALSQPYRDRIAQSLRFTRIEFVYNQPFLSQANGKHRFVLRRPAPEPTAG